MKEKDIYYSAIEANIARTAYTEKPSIPVRGRALSAASR